MQSVTDFVINLGAWNWFILAVAMMLIESIVPGVHFMWFGVAALAIGGVTLIYPLPIAIQLVAFAVVALATIVIVRRWWGPESLTTDAPDLNVRGHSYVGRTVIVEDAISGGRGKVRVGDTVWTAEGPDLPSGARVTVTGVNGTVLVVAAGAH